MAFETAKTIHSDYVKISIALSIGDESSLTKENAFPVKDEVWYTSNLLHVAFIFAAAHRQALERPSKVKWVARRFILKTV
ncbi:hypothetical protein KEM56_000240 [Ascosphaera pollenicola]|nr:hypothetical protein KEM56_000240 [Ascosphaera pollenicola]